MNSNLEIIAFAFTSKSERKLNSTQLGQTPEEVAAMAAMARALAGRRDSLKEREAGWLALEFLEWLLCGWISRELPQRWQNEGVSEQI